MQSLERISRLTATSVDAGRAVPKTSLKDLVEGLGPARKDAWAKLITSAATAEGIEEDLMGPLLAHFRRDKDIHDYLLAHSADEARHHEAFTSYVWETFAHRKGASTLTDRIIYQGLFKWLKAGAARRPIAFILGLYFYELVAVDFYDQVKRQARVDGLPALEKLVASVEKDELRHRAGLKLLLGLLRERSRKADVIDETFTRFVIRLIEVDIDASPAALHNRKLRERLTALDFDLDSFAANTKRARATVLAELKTLREA